MKVFFDKLVYTREKSFVSSSKRSIATSFCQTRKSVYTTSTIVKTKTNLVYENHSTQAGELD